MEIQNFLEFISLVDPFFYLSTLFFIGIMTAGVSHSLLYFIILFLIYEIIIYCLFRWKGVYWDVKLRFGLFCAYFLGWLIGRNIIGDKNPMITLENVRRKKKNKNKK